MTQLLRTTSKIFIIIAILGGMLVLLSELVQSVYFRRIAHQEIPVYLDFNRVVFERISIFNFMSHPGFRIIFIRPTDPRKMIIRDNKIMFGADEKYDAITDPIRDFYKMELEKDGWDAYSSNSASIASGTCFQKGGKQIRLYVHQVTTQTTITIDYSHSRSLSCRKRGYFDMDKQIKTTFSI